VSVLQPAMPTNALPADMERRFTAVATPLGNNGCDAIRVVTHQETLSDGNPFGTLSGPFQKQTRAPSPPAKGSETRALTCRRMEAATHGLSTPSQMPT
jgi:hypothetical protein